jgi:hypothetical protein
MRDWLTHPPLFSELFEFLHLQANVDVACAEQGLALLHAAADMNHHFFDDAVDTRADIGLARWGQRTGRDDRNDDVAL